MSSSSTLADPISPVAARRRRKIGPLAFGLAALACFLIFDRVAAAGLGWILLYSDDRIAKVYAGGRDDDVLVLGASVGNAMLLPPDLAVATQQRVFTMAVHGLDAITQSALVRDYLALNAPSSGYMPKAETPSTH
jgi:hypothetical protein